MTYPPTPVVYPSAASARAHFKDLLDAAFGGQPAVVRRESRLAAVVDAEVFRAHLARLRPSRAVVVAENAGWTVLIPGLPVAVDGDDLNQALAEAVDALREYAADWSDHLRHATNHAGNWDVAQLIELSSDEQLRDWLIGDADQ